jgi:Uma2 family endonuclease
MSIAFQPTHPVTDEELLLLSKRNPGMQFERSSRGELIVAPPTGTYGGRGEMELGFQISTWARQDGCGFVLSSDGGIKLPDSAIFSPDATWISWERWKALPEAERQGYARIAPDAAFELLSPGDTLPQLRAKAAEFLANGTRLVVLLDPRSHTVELHRPGAETESHLHPERIALDPELPGCVLDAQAIFDAMKD